MKKQIRIVIFISFLLVCSETNGIGAAETSCNAGAKRIDGTLLVDQAIKKYAASLGSLSIPNFEFSGSRLGIKYSAQCSNVSIVTLRDARRTGRNFLEAKVNDTMSIRIAVAFTELKIEFAARISAPLIHEDVKVEVLVPETGVVAEIREVSGTLKLTNVYLKKSQKLQIKVTPLKKVKWLLQKLLSALGALLKLIINKRLEKDVRRAVERRLERFEERLAEKRGEIPCSRCTHFDDIVHFELLTHHFDPAPIRGGTTDLLASVATAKVLNGTIEGLLHSRQSGDFVARLDDCGAHVFIDATLRNVTVTLFVHLSTLFVDFNAILRATLSVRFVIEIIEKNATLHMRKLVVSMLDEVDVSIKPIGTAASYASWFLSPKYLASLITRQAEPLANKTIQNNLKKLHNFIRED